MSDLFAPGGMIVFNIDRDARPFPEAMVDAENKFMRSSTGMIIGVVNVGLLSQQYAYVVSNSAIGWLRCDDWFVVHYKFETSVTHVL